MNSRPLIESGNVKKNVVSLQTNQDVEAPVLKMRAQMKDAERMEKFVFAGNSIFTLVSRKTGNRFTFRLRKPKPNKQRPTSRDMYFCSLYVRNTYLYFGYVIRKEEGGYVFINAKPNKTKIDTSDNVQLMGVKTLLWFLRQLENKSDMLNAIDFWHEGRCGKCGRPLTVPESIDTGIGPHCVKILGGGIRRPQRSKIRK